MEVGGGVGVVWAGLISSSGVRVGTGGEMISRVESSMLETSASMLSSSRVAWVVALVEMEVVVVVAVEYLNRPNFSDSARGGDDISGE